MIRQSYARRRLAFTLVELLVVIAIIGILVALTTAAVMVFLKKPDEVRNKVTIDQLGTSVTNFKNWANFYPPSKIRLCRYRTDYGTSNYEIESLSYINYIWGDIDQVAWADPTKGINWDNGLDPTHKVWDLE